MITPILRFFVVTYLLFFNTSFPIAIVLCILFGAVQAVHVLNCSALRNKISTTQIATVLTVVNMFLPLSGGFLQATNGALINHLKQSHESLYALQTTLIIIPTLMILSFIIALFIKDSNN